MTWKFATNSLINRTGRGDESATPHRKTGIEKSYRTANLSLQTTVCFRLALAQGRGCSRGAHGCCRTRAVPTQGVRAAGQRGLQQSKGMEAFCHKYLNGSFGSLAWQGEWLHRLETAGCVWFQHGSRNCCTPSYVTRGGFGPRGSPLQQRCRDCATLTPSSFPGRAYVCQGRS